MKGEGRSCRGGDRRPAPAAPLSFLRVGRRTGYPPEYLLSRVRGRRSKLIRNWRSLLLDPSPAEHLASPHYQGFVRERAIEGLWRALLREHAWIYGQMDEGWRGAFAPYFLYAELRTVIQCLRFLQGERSRSVEELLEPSLLSRDVSRLLRSSDAGTAVEGLSVLLSGLSPRFSELPERFRQEGMRGVERTVTEGYLGAVLALPLHRALRGLFTRLIDARNILALFKAQRMNSREAPPFLCGGTLAPGHLNALRAREDPFAVLQLVRQTTGISLAEPDPTRVETALYRGITKYLRKEGRDPLGMGTVLEYLWRCSLEVTNLSLLFAGRDLEREDLAAELVY